MNFQYTHIILRLPLRTTLPNLSQSNVVLSFMKQKRFFVNSTYGQSIILNLKKTSNVQQIKQSAKVEYQHFLFIENEYSNKKILYTFL